MTLWETQISKESYGIPGLSDLGLYCYRKQGPRKHCKHCICCSTKHTVFLLIFLDQSFARRFYFKISEFMLDPVNILKGCSHSM